MKITNQSSCMTLASDDAPQYQIWLQNVKQLCRYWSDEHSLQFPTFPVTWPWHNRAIQSFHRTIQLMMLCHQTKFSCKRISSLHKHSLAFWTFAVTLTLNAVIHFFSQDTLVYDDVPSDQVWLPDNQQFRSYSRKNHILIIWAVVVTLTLKIANIFFHKTLQLMMLHHHIKFGHKMFCGLEDI